MLPFYKGRLKVELLQALRSVFFTVVFVYCGLVAFLYIKQRDFIYFPDKSPPLKAAVNAKDAVKDITVTTSDGLALKAWFVEPSRNMPVIVFFHGNAGNISHRLYKVSDYANAGYGVLMAEYRGYGGNSSAPTEEGLYADGRAYFSWLNDKGYKDDDIILYGESLGTGVAVQMAKEHNIKALVLEAPYARLSDPAKKTYFFIPFVDMLMHDKYHSIDKISSVKAPKFFMVAGRDEVVGPQTGLNLFEVASKPKKLHIFERAGHNTIYQFGAASKVLIFLSTL